MRLNAEILVRTGWDCGKQLELAAAAKAAERPLRAVAVILPPGGESV